MFAYFAHKVRRKFMQNILQVDGDVGYGDGFDYGGKHEDDDAHAACGGNSTLQMLLCAVALEAANQSACKIDFDFNTLSADIRKDTDGLLVVPANIT